MYNNITNMNVDSNKYDTFESTEGVNEIKNEKSYRKIFLLIVLIASTIAVSFLFSNDISRFSSVFSPISVIEDKSHSEFSISIFNPTYGVPNSITYLPWDHIAESFKVNQATVDKFTINGNDVDFSDYTFIWNIDGKEYQGHTVFFQVNKVDIQTGYLSATKDDKSYNYKFSLAIKYIRRELRTLSNQDRETFLDALHTLYTTSKEDGVAKYGSKFVSAEEFSYRHLNGAARVDCDHWHDGAGIVNHHVAYTLEIEQALQSIDPSISMPYWEYAMDGEIYEDWQDSPIYQDDWFGDNNPANHELTTGRWGDIQLPSGEAYKEWSISDTNSLNPFVNGRGQLRSPWNNNPSNYITRGNTTYNTFNTDMPGCFEVFRCYKSDSLSSMFNCLNGVTHGPVHILVGGAWDTTENEALYKLYPKLNILQTIDRILYFKLLWRTGYTRCPTDCNVNEECKCAIPEEYIQTYGAKGILQNAGVWDAEPKYSLLNSEELDVALRLLQDPGYVGEMLTSGASFDPSFWPLHGQIERILGLKRLTVGVDSIGFLQEWGFDGGDTRVLNGVCDWSKISDVNDLTLPNCDFTGELSCWGHNSDDILEWSDFLGNGETYTNKEFFDFVHPANDDLPYVYDTYEFSSYCDTTKYPFV